MKNTNINRFFLTLVFEKLKSFEFGLKLYINRFFSSNLIIFTNLLANRGLKVYPNKINNYCEASLYSQWFLED